MSARAWLTARESELLPVPYFPEEFLGVHVHHPAAATLHETLRLTHRVMRPTSLRDSEVS